jgi:uncharacterized membrane protein
MNTKIISTLMLAIMLISLTSAFGITSFYWEEKQLEMYAGETKNVELLLQNMVGGEDISLKSSVVKGRDIAKIESDIYTVPFGVKEMPVNIEITTPKNAKIGDNYEVRVSFTQIVSQGDNMLQMTGSIEKSFFVTVSREREIPMTYGWIIGGIALLVIVGLVILLIREKKKK